MAFKMNDFEKKIARANGITPMEYAIQRKAKTDRYYRMVENGIDSLSHHDEVRSENIKPWYLKNETEVQRDEIRQSIEEDRNRWYSLEYHLKDLRAKHRYSRSGRVDTIKLSEEVNKLKYCPSCGKLLIEKMGKYGRFIGCSSFPECDYSRSRWK